MPSQIEFQNSENQQSVCRICHATDHIIKHCPQSKCGLCKNYGHTRGACSSNNFSTQYPSQQEACYLCHATDHRVSHCPQAICGSCRGTGHTRKDCPYSNASPGSNLRMARVYTRRSDDSGIAHDDLLRNWPEEREFRSVVHMMQGSPH